MGNTVNFNNDILQVFFKDFISRVVNQLASSKYGFPFVKFVFNKEDIETFSNYLNQDIEMNAKAINILKNNYNEYINGNSESVFIKIDDYHRFIFLLYQIYKKVDEKQYNFTAGQILESIWLRMNASDIDNVNSFLERQLNFMYNDNFFSGEDILFDYFKIYDLVYSVDNNFDCFETNKSIRFSLVRDSYDLFIPVKKMENYDFPVVHYAINTEDDKKVCYIYGIQNIGGLRKDKSVLPYLVNDKKYLRNKYVSPEFIMSLKLFIDLLTEKEIDTIKVPLIQILNYDYHKKLSKNVGERFSKHIDKEWEYELMLHDGIESYELDLYLSDKKCYDRFYNKEDAIAKNKYERLIETFMVMQEKYDNIDFINDPFIEGDNLIIKIKSREEVNDNKRLCR